MKTYSIYYIYTVYIVREHQFQTDQLCLLCLRAFGELNSRPRRCESCTQSRRRLIQRRLSAADYLCCVAVSRVVRCVGSRMRPQHASAFKHSQHSSRCCLMTSFILPQTPLLELRPCSGRVTVIRVKGQNQTTTGRVSYLRKNLRRLFRCKQNHFISSKVVFGHFVL